MERRGRTREEGEGGEEGEDRRKERTRGRRE